MEPWNDDYTEEFANAIANANIRQIQALYTLLYWAAQQRVIQHAKPRVDIPHAAPRVDIPPPPPSPVELDEETLLCDETIEDLEMGWSIEEVVQELSSDDIADWLASF